MKSAVFYGMSHSTKEIYKQAQVSCLSGNCTWAPFKSLAVCSACKNLTNQIEEQGATEPLIGEFIGQPNPAPKITDYWLPNGLHGDFSMLMTAYGTGNPSETISFTSYNTLIWSMTMMNFTKEEGQTSKTTVSALECGLWYCVNEYNSTVKGGNLEESVKPAFSERSSSSWKPIDGTGGGEDPLFFNNTLENFLSDLQLGDGFNVSQTAVYSISDLMNATFVVPSNQERINALVVMDESSHPDPTDRLTDHRFYTPAAMQSLYLSQDLDGTFASLAQSMTNHIRQNDDNGTISHGQMGTYVILIQIRGWFLVLPVVLVVGGAAFLAIALYHTHESKIAVWGTNILPIIALGEKIGFRFSNDDMNTSRMERDAKRQFIQFSASTKRQNVRKIDSNRENEDYEMLSQLDVTAESLRHSSIGSSTLGGEILREGR